MLKLKKLQILGFKSFCDRTELKFHGDGLAAIVGPNGCGKSNIADAISWVLGEQSARTLRGARMEDVIFAGTSDRKPTGMAEVSLTLVDPDIAEGAADLAEPEIEIQDEMPQATEDWDEAAVRAQAEAEAQRYMEEMQPGQRDTIEVPPAESPNGNGQNGNGSLPPDVVLKIRRRRMKPPQFRKGEIVVTRRLFRTGDSEYLMNGKLCRLRDIQDIFLGTGLGPESYAIIEQGRIGQILSSKPHDRRAIIEEAAGITKFKTKKRLAEGRLEQARQNLSRINDIFEEVTRQMNSLKRQAAKAERYARLREEMRAKLRVVLASRVTRLATEENALRAESDRITEEMRSRGEEIARLESESAERTERGYSIEQEIRANIDRLAEIALENDRQRAQHAHNQEKCAELEARAASDAAELGGSRERRAALEGELEADRAVLASAAQDALAAQQETAAAQHQAAAATTAVRELEAQQERDRMAILEEVAAIAELRNQVTQAQEGIAALEREGQRLSKEIAQAAAQIEAFGGQRGQLALEFESASERVASLGQQIQHTRRRQEELRQAETNSKRRLDGLRAEFAAALGKKSSLEAVISEYGYSTESVKRLFQSGALQAGFAPAGVLADFLEVEGRYERVVEDFLRDELNYVVVKSWDAADQGLQLLRSDVDGRATFLVHPDDSQAKFSFAAGDSPQPHSPRQAIVPLKDCIRVLNGFGKSLEVILPKLRDGYITPDASLARELALENPDAFFLAPSGECFHNVTVTGGKQPVEGPLSVKRELRDLRRQLTDLESTVRNEESKVASLGSEIAELTSLLEHLEEEKRQADRQAMTSGHSLQQVDAESSRLEERLAIHRKESARVFEERQQKENLAAERCDRIAEREARRSRLEAGTVELQAQLAGLKMAREAAAQTAYEKGARLAGLEERRLAAEATVGRIESLFLEVSARVQALEQQIEASIRERENRGHANARIAERLLFLASERAAAEERASELQAESEQARTRLAEIEQLLRRLRQETDLARDRRGELAAALAKLESDRQHTAETALNELGTALDELLADQQLPRLQGEDLTSEEELYRQMRTRLENMGPVNMMALEEYNETAERHHFLETQRKDLLDSIADTEKTIREIEIFSRQKFEEAFHKINENFQASFRKLFGGGQAFMRLTDPENAMESGIDVVASPPGKRLQNVLLLSGGEKALTALALLVGIFQYQPSPFCLLDEVDAPLDEANVGRFTELVQSLSAQTQFVLITHNKKTMSMAPVLYGVTMQEPGVSKLVSVRFGETAELARA